MGRPETGNREAEAGERKDMDHEEENPGIVYGDDLEKAIDRYTFEDEEDNELIETIILKQILDHFMPKWRKRTDPHYKLKKFATEQQLDKNLNKIREYVDIKCRLLSED